ncbi:hypothetical protein ACJIZ3_006233 [Penstemon smallii]|uniref:Uncharacterized protein n=1 Tax=Penstemon smallii TaxID=265156 RepID=A0ABD3S773_9LAMI
MSLYGVCFIVLCSLVLLSYLFIFGYSGWIRRRLFFDKGVKRDVLNSLPIVIYGDELTVNLKSDYPIFVSLRDILNVHFKICSKNQSLK